MKIDFVLDGKTITLNLNSNKPLSLILRENAGLLETVNHCDGQICGLCTVFIDGKAALACMVPAFELRGKTVETFDSFSSSKNMKDIEKAYDMIGAYPCSDCYASRSMLFESLVNNEVTEKEEILKELSIINANA